MIFIILCLSFFVGILWYLKVETLMGQEENFISTFGLDQKTMFETSVTLTYFMFTSLSTVGLGDLHPRGNTERVIGAFILLFGVMITSFVMQNFS